MSLNNAAIVIRAPCELNPFHSFLASAHLSIPKAQRVGSFLAEVGASRSEAQARVGNRISLFLGRSFDPSELSLLGERPPRMFAEALLSAEVL